MDEAIKSTLAKLKQQSITEMTMSRILNESGLTIPAQEQEVRRLIECLDQLQNDGVLQDLSETNGTWGRTVGVGGSWTFSIGFKVSF